LSSIITVIALLGGGLGGVLAANNFMGNSVHVPDVPEATNRIVVDFSEGILRQQDIGFVAVIPPPPSDDSNDTASPSSSSSKQEWRIFGPANGVMATVDAQLRNSEQSHSGVRKVPNLPSHLHVKNMDVHYKKRRQGVGKALMELVINYAKEKTDAKALTL
jgi:ribosomal protein S18 acetylase RimI-like enzyme